MSRGLAQGIELIPGRCAESPPWSSSPMAQGIELTLAGGARGHRAGPVLFIDGSEPAQSPPPCSTLAKVLR